jgi:redox-sensitive bicupin YhaK (pirin superfamily)
LLLDYATMRLPAGFPPHPHRGFDTVMYLLKGSSNHEDFLGNKGKLNAGDVQLLTAGKGIIHHELPASY